MNTARVFTPAEVDFHIKIEVDATALEGNVLISGDDDKDQQAVEYVRAQLDVGNTWAWAFVEIEASWAGFDGTAYLGAVSTSHGKAFADEDDGQMIRTAVENMLDQINLAGWRLESSPESIAAAVERGCKIIEEQANGL
jgi:hypothetical protein